MHCCRFADPLYMWTLFHEGSHSCR